MAGADFDRYLGDLTRRHPWLPADLARHYARLYGTLSEKIIREATSVEGLGRQFSALLFEAEIDYLRQHEWAQSAEDILERRTKHGLQMTPAQLDEARRFISA